MSHPHNAGSQSEEDLRNSSGQKLKRSYTQTIEPSLRQDYQSSEYGGYKRQKGAINDYPPRDSYPSGGRSGEQYPPNYQSYSSQPQYKPNYREGYSSVRPEDRERREFRVDSRERRRRSRSDSRRRGRKDSSYSYSSSRSSDSRRRYRRRSQSRDRDSRRRSSSRSRRRSLSRKRESYSNKPTRDLPRDQSRQRDLPREQSRQRDQPRDQSRRDRDYYAPPQYDSSNQPDRFSKPERPATPQHHERGHYSSHQQNHPSQTYVRRQDSKERNTYSQGQYNQSSFQQYNSSNSQSSQQYQKSPQQPYNSGQYPNNSYPQNQYPPAIQRQSSSGGGSSYTPQSNSIPHPSYQQAPHQTPCQHQQQQTPANFQPHNALGQGQPLQDSQSSTQHYPIQQNPSFSQFPLAAHSQQFPSAIPPSTLPQLIQSNSQQALVQPNLLQTSSSPFPQSLSQIQQQKPVLFSNSQPNQIAQLDNNQKDKDSWADPRGLLSMVDQCSEMQTYGMLFYAMSQGNYEVWKDLWTKILDANHSSINQTNFKKHQDDFRASLQKDSEAHRQKVKNFFSQDKKSVDASNGGLQNKDEAMSEASTQDDNSFELTYNGPKQLMPQHSSKMKELMKKVSEMDKELRDNQRQLNDIDIRRQNVLRRIEISDMRLRNMGVK